MEADSSENGTGQARPLRRFVLRLVVGRASVEAHEVGADGSEINLHDSKSFVELVDLRGEFVTQASYFTSQLGLYSIHLVAKAMNVVTEA